MAENEQDAGGIAVALNLDTTGWSSGIAAAKAELAGLRTAAAGVTIAGPRPGRGRAPAGVGPGQPAAPGSFATTPGLVLSPAFNVSNRAVRDIRVGINKSLRESALQGEAVGIPIKLGRVAFAALRSEISSGIGEVPISIKLGSVRAAQNELQALLSVQTGQTMGKVGATIESARASRGQTPKRAAGGRVTRGPMPSMPMHMGGYADGGPLKGRPRGYQFSVRPNRWGIEAGASRGRRRSGQEYAGVAEFEPTGELHAGDYDPGGGRLPAGSYYPAWSQVNRPHQGRGVGSWMYAEAERYLHEQGARDPFIRRSNAQSAQARRMWSDPRRPFGGDPDAVPGQMGMFGPARRWPHRRRQDGTPRRITRIGSLAHLRQFSAENPGLYSRWTPDLRADMQPGAVSAHLMDRGRKEIGISADPVPRYPGTMAEQLIDAKAGYDLGPAYGEWDYRRRAGIRGFKRRRLWLMHGTPVGSGIDTEPLLDPTSIRPVAAVSRRAVNEMYLERYGRRQDGGLVERMLSPNPISSIKAKAAAITQYQQQIRRLGLYQKWTGMRQGWLYRMETRGGAKAQRDRARLAMSGLSGTTREGMPWEAMTEPRLAMRHSEDLLRQAVETEPSPHTTSIAEAMENLPRVMRESAASRQSINWRNMRGRGRQLMGRMTEGPYGEAPTSRLLRPEELLAAMPPVEGASGYGRRPRDVFGPDYMPVHPQDTELLKGTFRPPYAGGLDPFGGRLPPEPGRPGVLRRSFPFSRNARGGFARRQRGTPRSDFNFTHKHRIPGEGTVKHNHMASPDMEGGNENHRHGRRHPIDFPGAKWVFREGDERLPGRQDGTSRATFKGHHLTAEELDYAGNLRAVAGRMSPAVMNAGRAWYPDAGQFGQNLASELNVDYDKAMGTLAALSAGTAWDANKKKYGNILRTLSTEGMFHESEFPYSDKLDAHRKAIMILSGVPPEVAFATSPKVGQFHPGIKGDLSTLTLDRWAFRTTTRGAADVLRGAERERAHGAWLQVAEEFGMQPAEFQAAMWIQQQQETPAFRRGRRPIEPSPGQAEMFHGGGFMHRRRGTPRGSPRDISGRFISRATDPGDERYQRWAASVRKSDPNAIWDFLSLSDRAPSHHDLNVLDDPRTEFGDFRMNKGGYCAKGGRVGPGGRCTTCGVPHRQKGTPRRISLAYASTLENEGGTFLRGGGSAGSGYAVALGPGSAHVVKADDLRGFARAFRAVEKEGAPAVGTWLNEGLIHVDPVAVAIERRDAELTARRNAQLAFFDLLRFNEINTRWRRGSPSPGQEGMFGKLGWTFPKNVVRSHKKRQLGTPKMGEIHFLGGALIRGSGRPLGSAWTGWGGMPFASDVNEIRGGERERSLGYSPGGVLIERHTGDTESVTSAAGLKMVDVHNHPVSPIRSRPGEFHEVVRPSSRDIFGSLRAGAAESWVVTPNWESIVRPDPDRWGGSHHGNRWALDYPDFLRDYMAIAQQIGITKGGPLLDQKTFRRINDPRVRAELFDELNDRLGRMYDYEYMRRTRSTPGDIGYPDEAMRVAKAQMKALADAQAAERKRVRAEQRQIRAEQHATKKGRGPGQGTLGFAAGGYMGGGDPGGQPYIVGEIGRELFVPSHMADTIPQKVFDQLPTRAGGGMVEIGGGGEQVWTPPEDGWIIPNRLMNQVPHRLGGTPGGPPDLGEITAEELRAAGIEPGELFDPKSKEGVLRKVLAYRRRTQPFGPPPVISLPVGGGFAHGEGAAVRLGSDLAQRERAAHARTQSILDRMEMRGGSAAEAEAAATRARAAAAVGATSELAPPGNLSGETFHRLLGRRQEMAAAGGLTELERQRRAAIVETTGVGREMPTSGSMRSFFGRLAGATIGGGIEQSRKQRELAFAEADYNKQLGIQKITVESNDQEIHNLNVEAAGLDHTLESNHPKLARIKTDIARLTEESGEATKKLAPFTEAVVAARKAVQPGIMGVLRGGLGTFTGLVAYQLASEALSFGMEQATKAAAPMIDEMTGFSATSQRVTKDLGASARQLGGNVLPVIAQAAVAAGGIGTAGYELLQATSFRESVTAKAGAQAAVTGSDLRRAAAGAAAGAETGLHGGYGGLFGNALFAEAMGGGKGYSETKAGDIKAFAELAGRNPVNALPSNMSAIDVLLRELGGGPALSAADYTKDNKAGFDALTGTVKDMNEAEVRGAKALGASSTGLQFMTRDMIDTSRALHGLAKLTDDEFKGLQDQMVATGTAAHDHDNAMTMATSGVVLYDAAQRRVTDSADAYNDTLKHGARGETLPTLKEFVDQARPQFYAARAMSAFTAQRERNLINPFEMGLGLARNPIAPATTGMAPGFEGLVGGVQQWQDNLAKSAQQGIENVAQDIGKWLGADNANIFRSGMADVTRYGKLISDLNAKIADRQAAQGFAEYSNNLRVMDRTISDAFGAVHGGVTSGSKANLGAVQKQQFDLSQQSAKLTNIMSQRQINFEVATAGFGAHGMTGEERAANTKMAKIKAKYDQDQLNISKKQVDLNQTAYDISSQRNLTDLKASRGLYVEGYKLAQEAIAASKKTFIWAVEQDKAEKKAMSVFNQYNSDVSAALSIIGPGLVTFQDELGSINDFMLGLINNGGLGMGPTPTGAGTPSGAGGATTNTGGVGGGGQNVPGAGGYTGGEGQGPGARPGFTVPAPGKAGTSAGVTFNTGREGYTALGTTGGGPRGTGIGGPSTSFSGQQWMKYGFHPNNRSDAQIGAMLLQRWGAPVNAENIRAVAIWVHHEGGKQRNNPLNLHSYGGLPGQIGYDYVSSGDRNVAVFSTIEDGVAANARNLARLGHKYPEYGKALASLRAGDPQGFLMHLTLSPWAASHYGRGGKGGPQGSLVREFRGGGGNYAVGSYEIQRDQMAQLHMGEMVVRRRDADVLRRAATLGASRGQFGMGGVGGGGGVVFMPGSIVISGNNISDNMDLERVGQIIEARIVRSLGRRAAQQGLRAP